MSETNKKPMKAVEDGLTGGLKGATRCIQKPPKANSRQGWIDYYHFCRSLTICWVATYRTAGIGNTPG